MDKIVSRRTLLKTGAAVAGASALSLPFVHGAHAAGKLNVAFWDHWVPGANDVMTKLCKQWAEKEKVEISIDYVTSQGEKLMLTSAAEAQAKSGHDMITLPIWYGPAHTEDLEPADVRLPNQLGFQDQETLGELLAAVVRTDKGTRAVIDPRALLSRRALHELPELVRQLGQSALPGAAPATHTLPGAADIASHE